MLESVFLLKFKPFGDSLGERIGVLSVGNVELFFQNWFMLSMSHPLSPHVKFGKQEWFAVTHYFAVTHNRKVKGTFC